MKRIIVTAIVALSFALLLTSCDSTSQSSIVPPLPPQPPPPPLPAAVWDQGNWNEMNWQ